MDREFAGALYRLWLLDISRPDLNGYFNMGPVKVRTADGEEVTADLLLTHPPVVGVCKL